MGLFDTVKIKANALAADAERAGKVTAAQARTVVLQNEIRKCERELGHAAFSLIDSGELSHPELEAAAARLRVAKQALHDKEAEIADLRGHASADGRAESSAKVATVEAVKPEAGAPEPDAAAGAAPAEGATPTKAAPTKPAAKRAAATKKAASTKPAASKPVKPAPARKPSAGKTAAKNPATDA